jgi:hypothetical protein
MTDLWRLTATEAVESLRKRELSPLELVEAAASISSCSKNTRFLEPAKSTQRWLSVGVAGEQLRH